MKRAVLAFVAACGADAPPGEISRHGVFPASATDDATVTIARPGEVETGDRLVVALQGNDLADNLIGIPDGWVLRWNVPIGGCQQDMFVAAWYLTGTARGGEEAYTFTFDRPATRAGLLAAYGNAREPNLLAQRSGQNGGVPVEIALPGTSCEPQSATVLLGVASFSWGTAPMGLVRQAGISGVVVYDAINEEPSIPPITVEIDDTFSCFSVAQLRIEPAF